MQHPDVKVLLEGHCDERGTVEYNLALGDRRAQGVKDFIVEFGVDAGRSRRSATARSGRSCRVTTRARGLRTAGSTS